MSFKVLVSDKLSEAGLQVLREAGDVDLTFETGLSEEQLVAKIGDFDALLVRSATKVTPNVLEAATNLKAIGRAGIGVDNIHLPTASKKGIVVMNTPFGNAVTTAEHALSLLSTLARNIARATASMREGKWEKKQLTGTEKWNKTLGIVGLGNIGKIVADRALGMRMKVIASDPVVTKEQAESLGVELVSFDALLERADFVTIHAPAVDATKHLFGAAAFAKMKDSALLVNAARGGIVDELALANALDEGHIAGAALDVFEQEPIDPAHPILKCENVVLTPHLGASTNEAQERVGVQIAEQTLAFLRDGSVTNGVNVSSVSAEVATKLEPEKETAIRLGRLLAQLAGDARELRVTATGPLAELVAPLTTEALAAFLEVKTGEKVNTLSAKYVAQDRGIKVVEVPEPGTRVPTLRLTVNDGEDIHIATGRRSRGGGLRLVMLEGYPLDAVLRGHVVIVRNQDRPGVIGAVGTLLGKHDINVSRLQVGLDDETKKALAVWNVEGDVPDNVLAELQKLEHVESVTHADV